MVSINQRTKRILVITGGPGPERQGSLVSGQHVADASGGGSIGARLLRGTEAINAWLCDLPTEASMMISRHVCGRDATIGLIEEAGKLRLLPILLTEYGGEFYDYEIKHNETLRRHQCPAEIPAYTTAAIENGAVAIYRALFCRGFARVDFIIDEDSVPWFLEVNTLPGLSQKGNMATMAKASGMQYPELIDLLLQTCVDEHGGYRP